MSFAYLLTWVFLFYVFWTMIFIPYQSWGTDLATGFYERTRVAGFRDGASFAGYLLAALLPLLVLEVYLQIQQPSYQAMLGVLGGFFLISLPITIALCFIAVPEPVPVAGRAIPWRELGGILRRNQPFVRLLSAYLLDRTAMGVYFAAMPLAVSFSLGMFSYFLTFSVAISVFSLLFSPVWVRLGEPARQAPGVLLGERSHGTGLCMFPDRSGRQLLGGAGGLCDCGYWERRHPDHDTVDDGGLC